MSEPVSPNAVSCALFRSPGGNLQAARCVLAGVHTDKIKPVFTARATASGGRNGHTEAEDKSVCADLSVPNAMGSSGKLGTTTPEHLFAAGYSACFGGAINFVGKQHKRDASEARVTADVTIGSREGGGFGLAVERHVGDQSLPQAELQSLVDEAHTKICPSSHATRGNVDVTVEVTGA